MISKPLTSRPWYDVIWRRLTPTLLALASSTSAPTLASAGLFDARMFQLSNGMQVVLIPDHRAPVVTHMLWYRVGSADEPPGKSGLAHFFEHLMFKGTPNHPGDAYARLIDRAGGGLNAFTSYDYTAYYATVGTESLELVMTLEADRMMNLTLSEEKVRVEREVIVEERLSGLGAELTFSADREMLVGRLEVVRDHRDPAFELLRLALTSPRFDADAVERMRKSRLAELARLATDPNHVARRTWWQGVFPNHPYGRDPAGTEADIAEITADDLRSAFMPRLARGNLIISAAGAISAAELAEALDRVFGDLPERNMPSALPSALFRPSDPLVVRLPFPQSSCVFGHMGVRPASPDYFPAIVLNHIVGGGTLTSRLFAELREKRGLVYAVRTRLEPLSDETLLLGWFATENDHAPTTIELVRREWQQLASGDVSDADIDAAKMFLKGALPLALDGTSTMAERLLTVQRLGLGMDHLTAWNAKVDAVTADIIRALARRLMKPEILTFALAGDPKGM